jgi:xylulokinase
MSWLGIDIGTSGVKAVLVDDAGAVAAQTQAPLAVDRPHPLWSEQQPDDWWSATHAAVRALPADLRAQVAGIGLSGQMHGAVLLGADDRPLRPAILWNDGRSAAQCTALESEVPTLRTITGNAAMPGFTAPKLRWVREQERDIFADTAKVLLPKDYVRLRLTGDHVSDMSDSAGTLWLDTTARAWSTVMLDACELAERHMPRLVEGNQVSGQLTAQAADALGLPQVPVAGGGGDNAAGAIGVGVTEPGQGFLSLGTSGVIFVVSEGYAPNPAQGVHAFCHALPDRWHQMAVILSAASALDWAVNATGFTDVTSALVAAEALGDGADVPLFLPYLSGERTPHNNPDASGVLFGLRHYHGPAHIVRAALEGVAFALADGADALRAVGTPVDVLTAIGGGARSAFWGRILASALDCRLDYRVGAEVGPALGAAHLARMAVTGEDPTRVCIAPSLDFSISPCHLLADTLAPRRALYRQLYLDLAPRFTSSREST